MAINQPQFNLQGKVALITGASKGIGESMARLMAAAGASVVVSSRKQEAVDALAKNIKDQGGEATGIAANMGNLEQVRILVEKTMATYGGIDILVNNAASNPVFGPVLECDTAAFDKIMDVNVKAPFELAKLVYPSMKSRGGGSVINISSIGGLSPEPNLGIYSVSKAALLMLTKVMAKEWGKDKIRVNAICPGLIQTKFSQALWQNEEILKRFLKATPLNRVGQPDEIGALALFLASDFSAYCTGTVFTADGGLTI
ncbi:glucose 1-dehydrogenase [Rhodocytophaga aerolata]|uniref:Glucose 1-dehydrogenase n=1 Tax=Rhodocytophaga aerolata TaxID=455078 RepID=A0ABT8QZA6_9BACT|nr:glucose 1-dehydrogenase [Rhodocytophaga aerolata]MDO1445176.1 glucose 1-dehydrogenase [Rhodocytophaga aerolata]